MEVELPDVAETGGFNAGVLSGLDGEVWGWQGGGAGVGRGCISGPRSVRHGPDIRYTGSSKR